MKRFEPIKRAWLKPPTPEQVRDWQSKPRKPLPRTGRKRQREAVAWAACRAAVISRSGGWCEGNVDGVCPHYRHGASHVHHATPADRAAGRHDPDRCFHLCVTAHGWVHANPEQAHVAGLLRPR